MTVQTRNVYLTVHDAAGIPLENAKVKIRLVGVGNEPGGAVSPESRTAYTDEDGYVEFQLWENRQDYSDTYYELSSWHPTKRTAIHARVPFRVFDSDADIVDLISTYLAAVPVDATQALLDQVIAARTACENFVVEAEDNAGSAGDSALDAQSSAVAAQASAINSASSASSAASAAALALANAGAAPLPFYSGTPVIDLNNFTTAGQHFVVPFPAVAGVLNHPADGKSNTLDPTRGGFIDAGGECQGVEIKVFQTFLPGFPASPAIWQRATLLNVGTTLTRLKKAGSVIFGAWQVETNSALLNSFDRNLFIGIGTQVSSGGHIYCYIEGGAVWVEGYVDLLLLNGSETIIFPFSNMAGLNPNTFATFPLYRENSASTALPQIVFSQTGDVKVISASVTAPGRYYFSGRYLGAFSQSNT
jgi:hypothetical protein